MTSGTTRAAVRRLGGTRFAIGLLAVGGALTLGVAGPAGAAGPASVTIAPSPSGGQYQTGQTVSVTVGPNSVFVPDTRVVILECADPGGTVANLPTAFIDCDGNTIQGDTVTVAANGGFAEHSYTLYALPNSALGESGTNVPVCNATQPCVLFVGENQNDFSQPKLFSQPFTVSGTGITTPGHPATGSSGTSTTASGSTSGTGSSSGPSGASGADAGSTAGGSGGADPGVADAAGTAPTGTLAFTGAPDWLLPLGFLGLLLILIGTGGRILTRRERT